MAPRHSTQSEIDPFQGALRPPANETPAEREQRERTQALAREVSRAIDERILEDKKLLDKKKEAVKVLLLGQAESGKSTTLKSAYHLCFSLALTNSLYFLLLLLSSLRL
jgi:guanine nucleotide-binding protein alpha-1 subunit